MKTRTLVLIGVLIIALAAMAMPVMADDVGVSGDLGSGGTFTVTNQTLKFASFAPGSTNYISPTALDSIGSNFASIHMTDINDPAWHIDVSGTNSGYMTTGSYTLGSAMGIKNATAVSGIGGITAPQALTGSAAQLFTGGVLTGTTDIPLELSQAVAVGDTAATGYAITVTVQYTSS